MDGDWISALRKEMKIPPGKKIPKNELEKAEQNCEKLGRRARLAMELKKLDKKAK